MLPTGRNIHAFDPFRMPTEFACRDGANRRSCCSTPIAGGAAHRGAGSLGVRQHQVRRRAAGAGAGADGCRPRFDSFGRLSGADLVPLAELGRPRIDVIMTLSGIFRDLLPLQTRMLAEAALKAATADEPDEMNFIRAHALAICRKHGCGHRGGSAAGLFQRRRRLRVERQHAGRQLCLRRRKTNSPTPTRRARALPTA